MYWSFHEDSAYQNHTGPTAASSCSSQPILQRSIPIITLLVETKSVSETFVDLNHQTRVWAQHDRNSIHEDIKGSFKPENAC